MSARSGSAAALLAALLACPGLCGAQDAGSDAASAPAKPPPLTVSVVGWQDTSMLGDAAWLSQAGPDLVSAQLAAQDSLAVQEREAIGELAQEHDLTATQTTAAAATFVVGGSYHVDGLQVEIHVRISEHGATRSAVDQAGALSDYASLCRGIARECAAWFAHHGGASAGDVAAVAGPPLSAASAYYRGRHLMQCGDKERAVADFLRAVHQAPDFAPAWNDLGVALDACGHPAAAAVAYEQASACDDGDPEAPRMLWAIANRLEAASSAAAIPCYRRLIANYPLARARLSGAPTAAEAVSFRDLAIARLHALGADALPPQQGGR